MTFDGYLKRIWGGFVYRSDCINQYVLYGDDLLYYECLLYDSQSYEDTLYVDGCVTCNSGWVIASVILAGMMV